MHWKLLVTVSDLSARDSYTARVRVTERLMLEGSDKSGIADWFVIGGRWSGSLTEVPEFQPGGERDPHAVFGHEDDALRVDERLYTELLECFEGRNSAYRRVPGVKDLLAFWDGDGDCVSRGFIGTKWLVVVDCHR